MGFFCHVIHLRPTSNHSAIENLVKYEPTGGYAFQGRKFRIAFEYENLRKKHLLRIAMNREDVSFLLANSSSRTVL